MIRSRSLPSVLLAGLLAWCPILAPAADDSAAKFRALVENYYDEFLALYPIESLINGDNDPRFAAVWQNDLTSEHRASVAAMCDRYLAALAAFDRAKLSGPDQLSRDSLHWMLTERRAGLQRPFELLPLNQINCPTLTFVQMGSGSYLHPFKTAQNYRDFLSRARGFSGWVDSAITNMRTGLARNIVPPRILMERVLTQLEPQLSTDEGKNVFFTPLQTLPTVLAAAEREKLAAEYRAGIQEIIIPAFTRLHRFVRDDYLPRCRATAGIGAIPGGAEAYAWAVRWQTTTDLTPSAIHQLGLREVARIRRETDRIREQTGFKGSYAEFLQFLARDARFRPFRTDEEILQAYRAIESRVMAGVPKLFGRVPRTRFEIRATEKFRAATSAAEYIAGSADGTMPGVFFVPIVDPAKFNSIRMEDLFLHEAIPGHHFQLSLALENQNLPRFRRFDANNAFVEGWALYTESLGRELGVYTDPYQYLGMLGGEMHRAIRLVVDTGIHELGWTREQALDYAVENEGGTHDTHRSEIERYMAWPGQALGYKVGQLKIRELRTRAEARLGPRFDLRTFHNEILDQGALPLAVLEAHLDEWTENRAK